MVAGPILILTSDEQMQLIKLSFVVTFALVAGASGGAIAAITYILLNVGSIAATEALTTLALAPIFQALVVALYAVLGYPAYVYLAKRGILRLGEPMR